MDEFLSDGITVPKKKLFGSNASATSSFYTIEPSYMACKPKQLTLENANLTDTECIANYTDPKSLEDKLQAIKKYIGNPQLNIFANQETFDLRKFDGTKVVKEMSFYRKQIDKHAPNWQEALIQTDTLEDETALFNLGVG